jgi:3-dehydroquinate synthase
MIGVIRQPEFILCDPDMLRTLDQSEYRMGFAEVIKYGAILDAGLFEFLRRNREQAMKMDPTVMEKIISICVNAKCHIVEKDEKESGERKILNFGHTFAHAFEKLSRIPHGEAVAIGMVLAAKLSERMGMISGSETERLKSLVGLYGLPVEYRGDFSDVFEVMRKDKKRAGGGISLILLESIGKAVIKEVGMTDLKNLIDDLC